MKRRDGLRRMLGALALFSGASAMTPAMAQTAPAYPTRPVRLVLPYAPGGVVDFVGRVVAQGLTDALGQSVVADNRPGAGGVVGSDFVAKAAADGYTALMMDPAIVINPSLQPNIPYDLFRDLRPVSVITSSPLVAVVAPQRGFTSLADLVAYGKANPGKLSYASAGIGTTPHLAGELLNQRTGIQASHIPYRGIAASYADIMAGNVDFSFSSIAGARGLTNDGKLTPLATTGATRNSAYPALPTVQEGGYPGFVVDLWLAVFVPVATPEPVVARLHAGLMTLLQKPETAASLARVGAEVRGTTPAEATALLRREYDAWREVITKAQITLQ
jgi:tripartite-type tricarboxylate transporter receptor subunit TctC